MVMLCLFYRNMRYGFKGRQKESVPGRKLIIVIVIFTSALSFTLGYFVGKTALKENQPIGVESQRQIIATPQHETEPLPQEQLIVSTTPRSPAEPDSLKLKPVQTERENNPPLPPFSKGGTGGFSDEKETKSAQKTVIYTVQAGAFKNSKDAETLKHKLESKGYKAYIKKSVAAKDIKIFKVRTGEFMNKKDAEAVALKLKKAEGLKAFVTFKNEEAHVEDKGSSQPRVAK